MKLMDILNFVESFGLFEHYHIGRLNDKKKNSLGVYNMKQDSRHKAFGGNEVYAVKSISLLIHGDTNKSRTEDLAFRLHSKLQTYETFEKCQNLKIGDKSIYFLELLQDEPIDVDQDNGEIYEYVIEMNIYYERS